MAKPIRSARNHRVTARAKVREDNTQGLGLVSILMVFTALILVSVSAFAQNVAPSKNIPIVRGDPKELAPAIQKVRSTPRGYVIVGNGFGGDPSKVKVYENGMPVAEGAVMGVSENRISVFSVPKGRTGVSLEIAGYRTDSAYFTHVEPQIPDEEQAAEMDDTQTSGERINTAQLRARVQALPPGRRGNAVAGTKGIQSRSDGYLAREVLRLRDRVEMLEQELLQIRSQLGITAR